MNKFTEMVLGTLVIIGGFLGLAAALASLTLLTLGA